MVYLQIKSHLNYLLLIIVCLFFTATIAAKDTNKTEHDKLLLTQEIIPPADEVFVLKTKVDGKRIKLIWDIKENCYLYLHKFSFTDKTTGQHKTASFPKGRYLEDEYFGKVEVFFEQVEISVPLNNYPPTEIIVTYQGCNEKGYCYMPIKKFLLVDKSLKVSIFGS